MLRRRLIAAIPVLIGMSFLVFMLMHLAPGDPVDMLLGEEAVEEDYIRKRHEWGLDRPLPIQYWEFIRHAFRGDFGHSYKFGDPVLALVKERLPATIELALASFLVAILLSVPIGVYSATKHNSAWDHAGMTFALMGISVPNFWLGIMLIFYFGAQLQWLPVSGQIDFSFEVPRWTGFYFIDTLAQRDWPAFWDFLKHLLLPAVTLGTALAAITARITRSSMLDVIRQDYIMTARAKGLSEQTIIWKHAVRNALLTVVTILGLQLGALLSGSVVTETVFSWPGIGRLLIEAITVRDYKLAQGIILFFGTMYIFLNIVVDLLYSLIDPRIRL
ncbi:MAG: ABC transporter permease [Candidatus Binatia bacterium]